MSEIAPVLLAGRWTTLESSKTFQAINPATGELVGNIFPVSSWDACEQALEAAHAAASALRQVPRSSIAKFLRTYADLIDSHAEALSEMGQQETALPVAPRLKDVELPRTSNQLRLAADACEHPSWAEATIDTATGIRSCREAIGPVMVIGPNNFPLAFNGISGGDFAAAVAAGNPVIVKGHPAHPNTTRQLAELAAQALSQTDLPSAMVQLLYDMDPADGLRMMKDPRLGAVAFTGSKRAGLSIKEACDSTGTPVYLEMSSVNPVLMLPGAIAERGEEIAAELAGSCSMGCGQFCTNPGLIVLVESNDTESFVTSLTNRFQAATSGPMLTRGVLEHLTQAVTAVRKAGAELLTGGEPQADVKNAFQTTLLRVSGNQFLADPERMQTEMFGPVSLLVIAEDQIQAEAILNELEGNLTGCVYSAKDGRDDGLYDALTPLLQAHVGRLLNDKMPTGVAVSPAMNHGGPFPSTGHPGFTAVGIPAALKRFSALKCYDNVRPARLPELLANKNVSEKTWRWIDGQCSCQDLPE